MPASIPLTHKNDIKIFILYLLSNIGFPVTFTEIVDAATSDGIVRYFDFAPAFTELMDAGHIIVTREKDTEFFNISAEAKTFAADLESGIALDIREKSLYTAIRHIDFSRRKIRLEDNVENLPNGKYLVTCRIVENNSILLEQKIAVETELQVQKILINFKRRPEIIFRGTLSLMSGDINYIFDSK